MQDFLCRNQTHVNRVITYVGKYSRFFGCISVYTQLRAYNEHTLLYLS